jgi:predicted RNA-binding protein
MVPPQSSLFDYEEGPPQGTLEELASNPKVQWFIKRVLNDYSPPKRGLLLIPESHQRPLTRSKLYLKVREFLQEASLDSKFHIVFISNVVGACPEELAEEKVPNFKLLGRWFPDERAISRTARLVGHYLERTRGRYRMRVAYVRGSYIKSVRLASILTGLKVVEVLREEDMDWLKHMGIRWAKVGLRMEEAFSVFRQRMLELANVQAKLSGF